MEEAESDEEQIEGEGGGVSGKTRPEMLDYINFILIQVNHVSNQ